MTNRCCFLACPNFYSSEYASSHNDSLHVRWQNVPNPVPEICILRNFHSFSVTQLWFFIGLSFKVHFTWYHPVQSVQHSDFFLHPHLENESWGLGAWGGDLQKPRLLETFAWYQTFLLSSSSPKNFLILYVYKNQWWVACVSILLLSNKHWQNGKR